MYDSDFIDPTTGTLVATPFGCRAFVPAPLPPPHLDMRPVLAKIAMASQAIGELNGIGRRLTNPFLLVRPFMRREAVASSRIEGTVTSLSQLLLFEAEDMPKSATMDARETWNYVHALDKSLERLASLPISNRLICEAHDLLMRGVTADRGARLAPGAYKTVQNWIGARLIENARFVPAPPQQTIIAMGALEAYINNPDDQTPFAVRLALVHYQFETIHPFPDGNGRVGRLLIPLMLAQGGHMVQPLLYLSPYFENRYATYVDLLLGVSTRGDWLPWIGFFLDGVIQAGKDAIARIDRLQDLQEGYRHQVQTKRSSALLTRIIDLLFERPMMTVGGTARALDITYAAAKQNILRLAEEGIIVERGEGRPQIWIAPAILDVIGV